MKFFSVVQLTLLVIAFLVLFFAIFMMLVDIVAVVFLYVSLLPALLSFDQKNITFLKFYALLFGVVHLGLLLLFLANMIFSTPRVIDDESGASALPDFLLFETCSNEMFLKKKDLNQAITPMDQDNIAECLKKADGK